MALERISISLDEDLIALFEQNLRKRGYRNRSEAIRDLIRDWLETGDLESEEPLLCVGTLTYIYNHEERQLAERVIHEHHAHHDVVISTTHIHLDHDNCLETVILRGLSSRIKRFADQMIAMPGVRHGKLFLVQAEEDHHSHDHEHTASDHHHLSPRT